jgi:hypothetical protein
LNWQNKKLKKSLPTNTMLGICIFGKNKIIDMEKSKSREQTINLLTNKSVCKYQVYDHTLESFEEIKRILAEICEEVKAELTELNANIPIEYKERGKYEVEFQVAGDLLLFSMHSNIFEFPKAHAVMQTGYVKQDPLRSYCGTINIYNFLADSFKFNRINDIGYLIGRIFINKDKHFLVEGKRQLGFLFNDFSNQIIDKKALKEIIESALNYAIEFDLLVPPFEEVKFVSVQEMNQITSTISLKTGKRLGFRYEAKPTFIK